ncbi:DNA polymerase III subunit delta' [Porphyrobacter sp. YT40]|uniref:DNA polymerase III subunit delta' n=1 Tax=Porphyrobacter sp. YT40 TaxID=2547601 RepID=UPI0011432BD1|nr:DNA polymerase III subunit delta' [Porphyrobacter sp. YT40]QDH34851.1 DNA polymerase III subunit delta' [Porphyrobacter sp. YT40]
MTDWPNHAEAWRVWRDALGGERMHHGWLLAGKAGLGKRDFAMAAARELVAEPGVPQPEGDHPDIIVLTYGPKDDKGEKAQAEGKPFDLARSIRIKQIRAMQRRLITRPTLGSRRAIIIDPADDMEKSAANALLKSLEEPPAGTFFLLVTHRPARLLPTIRSRCRTLRFPVLSDSQLAEMLHAAGLPSDPQAVAAAEGSFGAAVRFAEQDLAPIARVMAALIAGGDDGVTGRGELARLIGPRADRERVQAVLDLAQSLVAHAARSSEDAQTRARLIEAHGALVALAAEAPTANFDAGMLPFEIGSLLVAAAPASEPAHG